ncbi:MAG TPA: zinc ribbon domain-containing protein [Acidiferrobacter sp.]|nr:zinc ribbon domain-containing protein [Acidiferrobacter sp.]
MTKARKFVAAVRKQWLMERTRCQSCGMPLVYDKKHRPGSIYCSYCHDGRAFVKDMALADMRAKVRGLLRDRKTSVVVRLYMYWRLATLRRWRKFG